MQPTPTRTPAPDAPPFRIRRARRGDAESLASLLREMGYAHGSDAQTVHWVISHPEIEIFVAADTQDRPVGMVSLSHRPQLRLRGRIATVDELVVTETWRRRGVGKALMQQVLERCGARALSVKRLEVSAYALEELRTFYVSCGFVQVDNLVMRHADLERQHGQ
ncbi:GNAT family N-acetyltransferase [Archangium violaceum]|uniref:GNAT family N-acetyltransferase n=1 Tax=Archangium violaceum TaxID=83451 RepID=UPI002B29663A|nr:GNAT family N-acetyltransferase [Archangium gephyra]WPB73429.1 GNAT family N-acetyltransferase [Archangium gephyra]